jgi:peptidoglycan/LPS O-acetylase OafA/YrhL
LIFVLSNFLTTDIYALSNLESFLKSIFAHLTFTHNLFHSTKDSINGVFWSLAVEVQFYAVFPLLCYFFRKHPFITYTAMSSISIIYRYVIKNNNDLHFLINQLPGFLDIFAAGMLGAWLLVFLRNQNFSEKLRPLFTFLGICFFIILICMLKNLYHFGFNPNGIQIWQSENRIFISLVFLFIAVCSSLSYDFWIKVFASKFLIFFSTISYNLYIYHQLIAREFFNRKFPLPISLDPHNDNVWQIKFTILSIAVSIIFSSIITFGFEIPILKNGFLNYFRGKKYIPEIFIKK